MLSPEDQARENIDLMLAERKGREKGIAPRKLGKGGRDVEAARKPFNETLPVIKPVREGLTRSRKRVLRCGGVTYAAKRRQRVPRPGY
jgi:hypothetical protein